MRALLAVEHLAVFGRLLPPPSGHLHVLIKSSMASKHAAFEVEDENGSEEQWLNRMTSLKTSVSRLRRAVDDTARANAYRMDALRTELRDATQAMHNDVNGKLDRVMSAVVAKKTETGGDGPADRLKAIRNAFVA